MRMIQSDINSRTQKMKLLKRNMVNKILNGNPLRYFKKKGKKEQEEMEFTKPEVKIDFVKREISFCFEKYKKEDLDKLNQILEEIKVSNLTLKDFHGYISTSYFKNGNVKDHYYGLSDGVLVYEKDESDEFYYRIMTEIPDINKCKDSDEYYKYWCKKHSDYVMRTMIVMQCDGEKAYIVMYHKRTVSA